MGAVRAALLPLGLAAIVYVCPGDGVAGPRPPEATAQRCAAAKIKEAGKKAHAKALCYAKAAAAGVPVSQACLDKADAQFSLAFANAEEKARKSGGCATTGDDAVIEDKVDAFVSDVVSELPATTTTTTTTTTTVTTSPSGGCCGSCPAVEFCYTYTCVCPANSRCGCVGPLHPPTTSCYCSGACCPTTTTTPTSTTTTTQPPVTTTEPPATTTTTVTTTTT